MYSENSGEDFGGGPVGEMQKMLAFKGGSDFESYFKGLEEQQEQRQ